jgi:hypothetical protein
MDVHQLQENALFTTLLPWEDDSAYQIGVGRNNQNLTKQDRVSYKAENLMSDNVLANVHAAAAEIGACKILGAYCYAGVWDMADHGKYSGFPDGLWSSTELEIKWRRSSFSMPVDRKDMELNRLVLWVESKLAIKYGCVCNYCSGSSLKEHTTVRILGGGYAQDLWANGKPYNNDTNRVAVPTLKITPIKEIVKWERK